MTPGPKLYLIRHGQPQAGFGEQPDPGLDERGHRQAAELAKRLQPLGRLSLITSPLRRARDTALPFERMWKCEARVAPAVAEIPSPGQDLAERAAWIRRVLRGRWSELPDVYQDWKAQLVAFLSSLQTPSLITTHFVAINAAVGAARNDDRMVCFEPDHCSCTVLEQRGGSLRVVSLGHERRTRVG